MTITLAFSVGWWHAWCAAGSDLGRKLQVLLAKDFFVSFVDRWQVQDRNGERRGMIGWKDGQSCWLRQRKIGEVNRADQADRFSERHFPNELPEEWVRFFISG